jgi:hypothetical protein
MVINKIRIGSLFKVAACLYGSIGLIVGVCFFLVSLLGLGLPTNGESGMPTWVAPVFGAGAVVILPLLYGTLGAIALSVVGALYNLAARTVGGIQVEIDRPL